MVIIISAFLTLYCETDRLRTIHHIADLHEQKIERVETFRGVKLDAALRNTRKF